MTGQTRDRSAAQQIDSIVNKQTDWRGKKLSVLRRIILSSGPNIAEDVKWKKPSKPEGVAVWSQSGIICVADILKDSVRLTFPKGALIINDNKLFNSRLDSNSVRAVDYFEQSVVDEDILRASVLSAITINETKLHK